MTDSESSRATLVGINHVALDVGDIEEALDFYGSLFEFELRGRTGSAVFLDMGDQFLALSEVDETSRDDHRHFGLVVDDTDAVERCLEDIGIERLSASGLEFHDPWGNRIQIVAYGDIQFSKPEHVLDGMGLSGLEKSVTALEELADKEMAPE